MKIRLITNSNCFGFLFGENKQIAFYLPILTDEHGSSFRFTLGVDASFLTTVTAITFSFFGFRINFSIFNTDKK